MKKFMQEFRDFALRGNVLDLAVGVLIGSAFQGVVTSLTDNILSPIIGLVGGKDFSGWKIDAFGVELKYGAFLTTVINFVLMALIVFLIVKGVNRVTKMGATTAEKPAPTTKKCPYCCTDIPIEATRCPNCTAELPTEKKEEAQPVKA